MFFQSERKRTDSLDAFDDIKPKSEVTTNDLKVIFYPYPFLKFF